MEQTENKQTKNKQTKKKPIIPAIISGILIIGAIIFLIWFNSPFQVIKRAIEKNDIATVSENYYKLEESEERKYVIKEMMSFIETQNEQFIAGTLDYDSYSYYLESLGKEILEKDDEFQKIKNNAEILNESRNNFQTATELFEAGDYAGAIEYYDLVNEIDQNYETARSQLVLSKEMQLVGTWKVRGDLGPLMADGEENFYGCSFPVDLLITFNDDGTGTVDIDTTIITDNERDKFWEKVADNTYYYYWSNFFKKGYNLEDIISASGYDSFADFLRGETNLESSVDQVVSDMRITMKGVEFTYYYDEKLIIDYDVNGKESIIKYEYSIDEDTNNLNLVSQSEGDIFTILSIKLPCVLNKVE